VAHSTFHISKLKLFLKDEKKLDQKQKMRLKVNVIEQKLANEIKSTI
jgi:hypothetical protein